MSLKSELTAFLYRCRALYMNAFKRTPAMKIDETEPLSIADDMEPTFPVEFQVEGTPVSLQAKGPSRDAWKTEIRQVIDTTLNPAGWATISPVSVKILYFPDGQMNGDIDNIVKPILDALMPRIYSDDAQVRRVWVEKFESDRSIRLENPTAKLAMAIDTERPIVYIRVDNEQTLEA